MRFGMEMAIGCSLCGTERSKCARLFSMWMNAPREHQAVCERCAHRIANAFMASAPEPMPMVINPGLDYEEHHNRQLIASSLRRMLEDATERGTTDDVQAILERAKALGIDDLESS